LLRYLVAGLLVVTALPASADYCHWHARPEAEKAAAMLHPGMVVLEWCGAECRGVPAQRIKVNEIALERGPGDWIGVAVNGKVISLADIYLRTGDEWTWSNMAMLLGYCNVAKNGDRERMLPEEALNGADITE
jgi:hypothetical protein